MRSHHAAWLGLVPKQILTGDRTILGTISRRGNRYLRALFVESLFKLLRRWRREAEQAGHTIMRVVVAYEAGRDGFWLARWLRSRDVETYVIHPTSNAVPRKHRRAIGVLAVRIRHQAFPVFFDLEAAGKSAKLPVTE